MLDAISNIPFIHNHMALIAAMATLLFGLSEVLAQIPSVEASSVYQLVSGWIKKAYDAIGTKPAA